MRKTPYPRSYLHLKRTELYPINAVIVRVLVILDIYFISVKYVLVSVKLMCVYVKLF
jgi:hypothetical protein